MNKGTLAGKVALVTGGGRGLGRAVALAFAAEGAAVTIVSRTQGELAEVADMIGSDRCLAAPGDVALSDTARRVVSATIKRFGQIDILVNNAAVIGPLKRIEELSESEWEAALGVNLKGVYHFASEVVPRMRRRKSGAIINVTSGLGSYALSPFGMYCIAKGALNQLTRILALELKEGGIQVNGLDPGVMDTAMQEQIRAAGPEVVGRETWERFVGLKENGTLEPTERSARLALFLATPPPLMTGEIGGAAHYLPFGFGG